MKIAFTGAHSTGKSALLSYIKKKYQGKLYTITEVARRLIKQGYPLGKDAVVESYLNYIYIQLKKEQETANHIYDLLISDRTILDPVAYSIVNKQLPRPFIPDSLIKMMETIWVLEKNFYDLFVFFPIEFSMKKNGIRPEDEEYRQRISNQIKRLLIKYKIKYIIVTGSIENRYQQIAKHIIF